MRLKHFRIVSATVQTPAPCTPPNDTTGWLCVAVDQTNVSVGGSYVVTVKFGYNTHNLAINGLGWGAWSNQIIWTGSGTTLVGSASFTRTPSAAGTATETLTATNISGTPYTPVSKTVTVTGNAASPPTISNFTASPSNATVGATVTLNATVANYSSLQINGSSVGSLPTTQIVTSNGETFTLTATGTGGTTSASYTLSNTTADADFQSRINGPGVFRYFDFNNVAQLGANAIAQPSLSYILDNYGIWQGNPPTYYQPTIDNTVFASGTGSLKIGTYPGGGVFQPASGGTWFANASPDYSFYFGANSKFYVQFRCRWDDAMFDTLFLDQSGAPQGGVKIFDVIAQDVNGGVSPNAYNGRTVYNTSSEIKVVTITYYQHKFLFQYRYDGSGNTANLEEQIASPVSAFDYKMQTAPPSPYCLYTSLASTPALDPVPGCVTLAKNEWCTFELEITTGDAGFMADPLSTPSAPRPQWSIWLNSTVRLWFAREGMAPVKVTEYTPSTNGYAPLIRGTLADPQQFFKLCLFPYMTDKSATQVHPVAYANYDEVIMSRAPIKFPGGFDVPGPAASSGSLTSQLAPNTVVSLPAFTCTDPDATFPGYCGLVTDFSGLVYDATRGQMLSGPGGGHSATNYDAVSAFSMSSLTWSELYPPTPTTSMVPANWDAAKTAWKSGPNGPYPRPTARHSYCLIVPVGNTMILLVGVDGDAGFPVANGWGVSGNYNTNGVGQIAHFDLTAKTWTYTSAACVQGIPGACYDTASAKIIMVGNTGVFTYDPVAQTLQQWIDPLQFSGAPQYLDEFGVQFNSAALGNALGYANSLTYAPGTDKFYSFNRIDGSVWATTLNRSNFALSTVQRILGPGQFPCVNTIGYNSEMKWNYDSANSLIIAGPLNGVMYAFNPATKAITTKSPTALAGYYVAYDAAAYDPVNNCHVILTYASPGELNASAGPSKKTWAYRWA